MAIQGFELYMIQSEYITADMLIWRRYMQRAPGMVEALVDANPQLAFVHRTTPFIPPGVYVRVPIDPDLLIGKLPTLSTDQLWTDKQGYTL